MRNSSVIKSIFYIFFFSFLFGQTVFGSSLSFRTQEFKPFSYTEKGQVAGPVAEIIREVCRQINYDCNIKSKSWARSQMEVKNGKANGMFVIGWNKARAKWVAFTPAILNTEYGFFVRQDNPLKFKSIQQVKGYKIGVYGPSNTSRSLEKIKAKLDNQITIDQRPDDVSGFKKLSKGRVDAVFSNRDVGNAIIQEHGLTNLKYAGRQRQLQYYIGFNSQTVAADRVNSFIDGYKKLYNQGKIKQIIRRYNLELANLKK